MSQLASGVNHAFITGPNGIGMTDLNSFVTLSDGAFLYDARGINDNGQIVAEGSDGFAYLLDPVPEPKAYLLLLLGLGIMAPVIRRRCYMNAERN